MRTLLVFLAGAGAALLVVYAYAAATAPPPAPAAPAYERTSVGPGCEQAPITQDARLYCAQPQDTRVRMHLAEGWEVERVETRRNFNREEQVYFLRRPLRRAS